MLFDDGLGETTAPIQTLDLLHAVKKKLVIYQSIPSKLPFCIPLSSLSKRHLQLMSINIDEHVKNPKSKIRHFGTGLNS